MRVVIVNAYNRHNAGDAALLSALIGQVRRAHPGAEICFAGLENPVEHPTFEDVRNIGSVRRWAGDESVGRPRRMGRKVAAVALGALPAPVCRWLSQRSVSGGLAEAAAECRAIAGADLVVGLGGGYLNGSASAAGTLNVFFLLLPLWLATRFDRPTVLAPQSYGPFGRWEQQFLVRQCLNRVDRIVVREDLSLAVLRRAGVHQRLLERGVDSAFAVVGVTGGDPTGAPSSEEPGPLRVGITARAWLSGAVQEAYERSLAAFIDWLAESRDALVTLVPQVTSDYQGDDDRLVSRRVASYCCSPPKVIDAQLDHTALRAVYGGFDYVVGTRFHSVIFSLMAGTPAVAIEYEHKTSGIMADLGLGEWVIPIGEATTARLCEQFDALVRSRPDYERQLRRRLPAYVNRADGFAEVLWRAVR